LSSAVVFASSSSSWSLEHRPFRPFEEHYPSDYCNFIVLFLRGLVFSPILHNPLVNEVNPFDFSSWLRLANFSPIWRESVLRKIFRFHHCFSLQRTKNGWQFSQMRHDSLADIIPSSGTPNWRLHNETVGRLPGSGPLTPNSLTFNSHTYNRRHRNGKKCRQQFFVFSQSGPYLFSICFVFVAKSCCSLFARL